MKIGIYGDSYADHLHSIETNPDISYVELLTREYGKLYFCAKGGSNVYYSYNQFIKTHFFNDRNIFIKTIPSRLWVNKRTTDFRNGIHIPSFEAAKNLKESTDQETRDIGFAAEQYFLHLCDFKKEELFDNLLIEKILEKRPDTIIIDANIFGFGKDCDWDYYNVRKGFHQDYKDLRHCHLSTEKHLILFEMIQSCLKNNLNDIDHNQLLNVKPSKPLEKAFTTDKTYNTISYDNFYTERFTNK